MPNKQANQAVITVTVVFSPRPREVYEDTMALPQGCTVGQALQATAVLQGVADTGLDALTQGVWGRKTGLTHVLRDQDRIELYRPLQVDPKVARRERFAKQGTKGAGLFAKRRAGAKAGY
jgi:uncharacterized protein